MGLRNMFGTKDFDSNGYLTTKLLAMVFTYISVLNSFGESYPVYAYIRFMYVL